MEKLKEKLKKILEKIINNEKLHKNAAAIASVFGILILVMGVILDLTYSGRINCICAEKIIEKLKRFLVPMGFHYHIASEVIFNSMGILFTTLSVLLTVEKNLSDRFEVKIFGIPRRELEVSAVHKIYNVFHIILIFMFPFMMLICINLKFCVCGYLILVYNLLFLIIDYVIMSMSYHGNKYIKYTVNKLFKIFQADHNANRGYTEYQVLLGEIRLGIERSEGWERAERLFECFVRRVSALEKRECYVSSYLFFDVIFCRDDQSEFNDNALRFIKKYVCELYENDAQYWNEVVFCALVKVISNYWNEPQINGFLKWFLDFAGRSRGGTVEQLQFIQLKQLIQINIVMVMIEECRTHQGDYKGSFDRLLGPMWFRGDLAADKDNLYSGLFEIVQDTEKCLKYKEDNTKEAYANLQKDYIKNYGISFIGNTIR